MLPVIAVTFRHLVTADWLFIATTVVFQPLSGSGSWWRRRSWSLSRLVAVVWPLRVRRALLATGGCGCPRILTWPRWLPCEARPIETAGVPSYERPVHLGWPVFIAFYGHLMVNKPV